MYNMDNADARFKKSIQLRSRAVGARYARSGRTVRTRFVHGLLSVKISYVVNLIRILGAPTSARELHSHARPIVRSDQVNRRNFNIDIRNDNRFM